MGEFPNRSLARARVLSPDSATRRSRSSELPQMQRPSMLQRAMSAKKRKCDAVTAVRKTGQDGWDHTGSECVQMRCPHQVCSLLPRAPSLKAPLRWDARPGLSNFAPKHLRLRWLPTPDAKDASSVDARPCRPRKRKRRLCNSVNGNPSWARPLELLSFSLNRQFYREMKEVREGGECGLEEWCLAKIWCVCMCAHLPTS